MAYADPQSVTVNAVAQSLARTGSANGSGEFTKDDQTYKLVIQHSKKTRTRHVARLEFRKIAADPLVSANNVEYTGAVTLTVDAPNVGYSNTELKDIVIGLADWLKAGTNAATIKLIAFEN